MDPNHYYTCDECGYVIYLSADNGQSLDAMHAADCSCAPERDTDEPTEDMCRDCGAAHAFGPCPEDATQAQIDPFTGQPYGPDEFANGPAPSDLARHAADAARREK